MKPVIKLLGLPGAGCTRFKKAFESHCQTDCPDIATQWSDLTTDCLREWTLIDVRSPLAHPDAEAFLMQCLSQSSAVVFSFVESADLDAQLFWQKWLTAHHIKLPVFRWFSQCFPEDWDWQTFGENRAKPDDSEIISSLETKHFSLGEINLEHLMFGLDAAKQNLGMDLWRVKGCLQTEEYMNPVALEGTVNRWDTFAADQADGELILQGKNLDNTLLSEILSACQAMG